MHRKHIVAFLDGRPGHEKQTYGIIESLRNQFDIELITVKVQRKVLWRQILLFFCLFLPGCKRCPQDVKSADLLIGTGSSTHLPMLVCKKKIGAPVVTCMSPNILIRKYFELCFVPEHDGLREEKNIRLTLGAPNMATDLHQHEQGKGLIAIGGKDEKSHKWEEDGIISMIGNIVDKESHVKWTITSSPRTPDSTEKKLAHLVGAFENAAFYRFADTQKGWIEKQYDLSQYVWVTSDSVSMIFEALSAGCQVGILPMRWKNVKSKFKRNENVLHNKKLVVTYEEWLTGAAQWPVGQTINESQRCAHLITKLWQNRI